MDDTRINLRELVTLLSSGEGLLSEELMAVLMLGPMPTSLESDDARKNFQRAFDAMGGLPRLLLYADRNPGQFYKLYARMLRQGDDIKPEVPPRPQWLSPDRLSYDLLPSPDDEEPDDDPGA